MFAASLFASSAEDRGLSLNVIKGLWTQKILPDEKVYEINVPIEKDEIIWIDELKVIPKGWYASIVVHWEDLMIENKLVPDLSYDYLDKNQSNVKLKLIIREDGRGVNVGPDANIGVSSGPIGVRMVGGKTTGITGIIRCKIFFRRNYETSLQYQKEQGNK